MSNESVDALSYSSDSDSNSEEFLTFYESIEYLIRHNNELIKNSNDEKEKKEYLKEILNSLQGYYDKIKDETILNLIKEYEDFLNVSFVNPTNKSEMEETNIQKTLEGSNNYFVERISSTLLVDNTIDEVNDQLASSSFSFYGPFSEAKSKRLQIDEPASSTTDKTELPIAQFISKIKLQLQTKLNGDETLLKLLSELEENCEFIVNIYDLDPADKVAFAKEGKKLSQELKQRIDELNKSIAALLASSFQEIENYYNQLFLVTIHYPKKGSGLVDGKLEAAVLQEATVTQGQGSDLEAKLEHAQQTVLTANNNIKKSNQSFFSIFKSDQHAHRDKLHNEETVKRKLVNRIPSHFQLGAAIGQGDCFFDAMAQSLNVLKGKAEYTAKSLRLLCDNYVKSGKYAWVKEAIEQDKDNYEQYLVRLQFTIEELEEEEKANTGLKLEDIVWGRPDIEGRMICEIVNVKLHVIGVLEESVNGVDIIEQLVDPLASEPITPIEKGQYISSDIAHLVNYQNHFVPLFDNKLLQAEKLLTQFLEVRDKRAAVSIPSSLAKNKFSEVIKEKIKQGANANSQYQFLLEKLVDPLYKEHKEFLKEEMRHIRKEKSNDDAQAYLSWLEKNYGKIGRSEFEKKAIDLIVREERGVEIRRWNVPNILSHFIGREHLLEQLAQRLNPKESQTSTVILTALHGLGRIGKTFLAARYAQLYAENYSFILWFNAESETILMNDYRYFADAFHLPIEGELPENIITIVKNWLEQQSNWLIIYDNAPNDQLIAKYRPAKGGKVLITSRKDSWNKKDSLAIDVFNIEEARAYIVELTNLSVDVYQETIDKLAKTLGYLPLALAQACAYIAVNNIGLEDYLKLYAENKAEMLADKTMPAEISHEPVAVTWHITFEAIKKQQPAASALLENCAFLQGSGIPEFLLKELFAKHEPELAMQMKPFRDALECLLQYNMLKFINQEKEGEIFSLHNLVQEVIVDTLSADKKQAYLLKIIELLRSIFPYQEIEQVEDIAKQRNLLTYLEKALGRVEKWISDLKKDEDHKELAGLLVPVIEKELYVPLLVLSAHGYRNVGDAGQQKTLLERALVIEEYHYGKDHPQVAVTLGNLANAIGTLGDARQKKALLKRVLVIEEQHYGKDHPVVAATLTNLGNAYGALGDAREQKALLERALEIKEQHYGKNHPEVAVILENLANAIGALGDAREQKALLERALVIKEQHYGKDHPQVARTLGNLAITYGDLGDARRQKALLEQALEIKEQHYGKDHPVVAHTLANLANALGALGDARLQKALLKRVLGILVQYYGQDHPAVVASLVNLGNTVGTLGDAQQQKDYLKRALTIQENHYGADHPEVAITLVNLGNTYGALEDV